MWDLIVSVPDHCLSFYFAHDGQRTTIELNVPREDFSAIAIELTFVTLGYGFKKAGSVLFDICAPGTKTF